MPGIGLGIEFLIFKTLILWCGYYQNAQLRTNVDEIVEKNNKNMTTEIRVLRNFGKFEWKKHV